MKKIINISLGLLLLVLMCFSTICFDANKKLSAQTENYSITKLNLLLPSNVNLTSFSTLDGENFTFTNNKTTLYSVNNDDYKNIEFKILDNSNWPTENISAKLRNGVSFVYIRTEQFANQNIFEIYKIFDNGQVKQEPYSKVFKNNETDGCEYHISQLSDMCFDYTNNLYMLDINNKAILTFNYTNDRIEIFKDLSQSIQNLGIIELNENSKMCCTINGKSIFILTNNKVYKLNTQTLNLEEIEVNSQINLTKVNDFSCDAGENLYFLTNDISSSTIFKHSKQNTLSVINLNYDVTEMFIEEYSGEMYYIIENEIYVLNYANFIASTIRHPAPINFNENKYLSQNISFAILKENTKLLVSPYALSEITTLQENSLILVLQNALVEEPEFTYCLFEQENKQTFGYLLTSQIKEYSVFTEYGGEPKSTFVITNAYKYPTKNSPRLTTINKNTTANILGYYTFTNTDININFYGVQIGNTSENKIAFIDKDLVFSQNINEITYTGGTETPNKYKKFTEYLLIIFALTILEIVTISIIVKKVKPNKKSAD